MARDVEVDAVVNDKSDAGLNSLAAKFRKTQQDVDKQSGNIGKKLVNNVSAGFQKASDAISNALVGATSRGMSAAAPAIIGGLAVLSPLIGGTIAAAVVGSAGIGGVVGGVLLASRDQRIRKAGTDLGKTLLGSLSSDASVFVNPVLAGIKTIQSTFAQTRGSIQSLFESSSQFVQPLVTGISRAVGLIINGMSRAASAAAPVIAAFQVGFEIVGAAVGELFYSLEDNADGAAAALVIAFRAVANGIRIATLLINILVEGFERLLGIARFLGLDNIKLFGNSEDFDKMADSLKGINDQTFASGAGFQLFTDGASKGATAAKSYAEQLEEQAAAAKAATDAQTGLFNATTSVGEATAIANKVIKEGKPGLDANTESGRKNRQTIDQIATALRREYDESVKVNGQGPETQRIASKNRAEFLKLATQLSGSAAAARGLRDRILGIPSNKKSKIDFDTNRASQAARNIRQEILNIPNIQRTITLAARITGSSASRSAISSALNKQSLRGAALGSFSVGLEGGYARTGGPTPVSVTSSIENTINLDGEPVRRWMDVRVSDSEKRTAWRRRVGGRYQK